MTGSHGCICRQAERWRSRHQLRVVMRTDTVSSGPITCVVVSAMGATLHLMPPSRQAIFDDARRSDPLPARHGESSFAFLNRITGAYWDHPRDLIQSWADRLPSPTEYADLRGRLRSGDDHAFNSAFLELFLHEMFIAAGYAVTLHPRVAGTSRKPDFLVQRDDTAIYVEAIVPGPSVAARAAANRRRTLFDTVNGVGDPNFMLWLEELKEGDAPPAGAALRRDLRRWLASLDPDAYTDLDDAPTYRWAKDGWSVAFKALPKARHARGVRIGDRSIGVYGHTRAGIVNDAPTIRDALTEKHHAYGDLNAPFIIAVGLYIFDTDRWHSTGALYGAEGMQLGETTAGERVMRSVRQADGYFGTPPEWTNRQVSGVLVVNQLQPYSVTRAEVTLWRHPDPIHPLPPNLGLPAEEVALVHSRLEVTPPVRAAAELFGLPSPWPPGEAWPREQA